MYLLLVEKEKTEKSHILFIKGLVYRLSHDCHFDIDRDVSTTVCGRNVAINIKVTIVRRDER